MGNSAFYIARRYLFAKKGSTAVTFITWLAAFAMMTAVASMFVIISVFSGLEVLNQDMIKNLHADLSISAANNKQLQDPERIIRILKNDRNIAAFSEIIEEKVLITYSDNSEIAYLRGVDPEYTKVNPITDDIFRGRYPSFEYTNEVIIENGLDNRLKIPAGSDSRDFAMLYMPKPGTGIISKEEDIFNKKEIYVSGTFAGNDQLNNYIVAPIELARQLLNLSENSVYQIVIKLKNPDISDSVKQSLAEKLGRHYTVKTKSEENSAFWKMINTEKMMIFLIFGLVIFITTFNLAGAVIILQLDKKPQAKALISLGFPVSHLRRTYFYTGLLIVLTGLISGLIVGTVLAAFQLQTGVFKATADLAFPVRILPENYLIVAATALFFGVMVSWIFSKVKKDSLLTQA